MLKLKRPIPVGRRFGMTHFFLSRCAPEGRLVFGASVNCLGRFILFQKFFSSVKEVLVNFDKI